MIDPAQSAVPVQAPAVSGRSKAPVFVLGCPRSGTTLLYHMLLSAGNFAVYRAESNVFNLLAPRFGDLRSAANRQNLMNVWLHSKLFRVSGLDAEHIRKKVMEECRSSGDFLRIVMEEIAHRQGVSRWADCTPDHLLYIPEIKRRIPEALIIHILRDGRDVALSFAKQGWARPLPWDRGSDLYVAGLYWRWIVQKGRRDGSVLGLDYREVYFEDLVTKPRDTLSGLSGFVGQELDYDRILKAGIGSVSEPNSSFTGENGKEHFNPAGRWKEKLTQPEVAEFEFLVGDLLQELGYRLASGGQEPGNAFRVQAMRAIYPRWFAAKLWLRNRTRLGSFVNLDCIEIEDV
jgi:hypothetical protein